VGDKVEVVHADESAHVAVAESQLDMNGGSMRYLTGCDLTDYDFVSIGKDGFIPISVKAMTEVTQLVSNMG
jgi:hypothetical protein